MSSITSQTLHSTLKHYFWYDSFRPLQEEIILHVTQGNDALVIMPTWGWKSICYQLPALVLEGMTLVISPLISLMKDQVDALKANWVSAAYINSTLDDYQRQEIRQKIKNNDLKLLYMAPESIRSLETIKAVCDISLIAVDEAHCISSRGHDFRPAYTWLRALKQTFPHTPLVALTATADQTTRSDIRTQLDITWGKLFLSSFDRPNLSLDVRPGRKRIEQIKAFLASKPGESGIIYCMWRKTCEKIADKLKDAWVQAAAYHAWLSAPRRAKVQDQFLNDRTQVICATIAFGMWIDKSNVRFVIHYNLPKNIEWFYQEIWRAWRDGLPSETILFYSYRDVMMLTQFAQDSWNSQVQLAKLERMKQYAESLTCRRQIVLTYFGEPRDEKCGNCDICKYPPEYTDGTQTTQKALSAIVRLSQKETMNHVIDFLRWSKNQYMLSQWYPQLKTYGVGADISAKDWQRYLIQMMNQGLFQIAFDQHSALKLTTMSDEVLFHGKQVELAKPQDHISLSWSASAQMKKETSQSSPSLLDHLKKLRQTLADQQWVPPHVILSDVTLQSIQKHKPLKTKTFAKVEWMSDEKIKIYGTHIIQAVSTFLELQWLKKPKAGKVKKWSTYMQTLDMYKQWLSVEEIMTKRDLSHTTIYGHLARLIETGESIDPYTWIDEELVSRVRKATDQIEDTTKLRSYYDFFKEKVQYHEIKLALAVIGREEEL